MYPARRRRIDPLPYLLVAPIALLLLAISVYPALYAIWLSMLNKRMTQFVGLGNFVFLLRRSTFHLVIFQSCFFAISAVALKATLGSRWRI